MPLYDERVKILDKLIGEVDMESLSRPVIGVNEKKNQRATQKAKENLDTAKTLKDSNITQAVRLLEKALI